MVFETRLALPKSRRKSRRPSSRFFLAWTSLAAGIAAAGVLFGATAAARAQGAQPLPPYSVLARTHDLALSDWGPYSKTYAGISHIPRPGEGYRFDVTVAPKLAGGKSLVPTVLKRAGYVPWAVDADMTRFTYRYELQGKDEVYVDVSYTLLDNQSVLLEIQCANQTGQAQTLALNVLANLVYPAVSPRNVMQTGGGTVWINAADYVSLDLAKKSATYNLVPDGALRNAVTGRDYIDGKGIGKGFGANAGDTVTYDPGTRAGGGSLQLLYRMKAGTQATLRATGLANAAIPLQGTGQFETVAIPYAAATADAKTLTLTSDGGGTGIDLNGIAIIPTGQPLPAIVPAPPIERQPVVIIGADKRSALMKYSAIPVTYGLAWDTPGGQIRDIQGSDLTAILDTRMTDEGTSPLLPGDNKNNFTDLFVDKIALGPNENKTIRGLLAVGAPDDVRSRLGQLGQITPPKTAPPMPGGYLPSGEKYALSQRLMRATVLSDIVYPVAAQGKNIRHYTPGKIWDSLYTWDSGFIALGLAEINPGLALQCLNTYTTPVGSQSAFIHHGSPVPTQMYAFWELWQRSQSPEMLAYFYPRLAQYYQFLSGAAPTSTTRNLNSSLLRTWDYFYNSGGWDDYPPQVGVHRRHLEQSAAPVVSTAQCIRVAKILRLAARELERTEDIAGYDRDIALFTDALQKYAWDETAGYYSYVLHDAAHNPTGFLKDATGANYNMGLDGVYPLVADIGTPAQQAALLDKVFSPKHLWSPAGIGAVDQSAPYYKPDGYWNGSVWMPHQWFLWKAMLDLGHADLASRIAHRGLDVYAAATDSTYQTWENFRSATGEGSGWHEFSGLSTPVLSWFSAYYRPGTVTTGFEVWIRRQSFDRGNSGYSADLSFDDSTAPHPRDIVLCLDPAHTYTATFHNQSVPITSEYPGLIAVHLPATNASGTLAVRGR